MLMFHHDDRIFDEGDTIIGNHYDIRKNILEKYQSSDLFPNMSDVLYMTSRIRENWEYDNVYQVIPKGKVVKCRTNYSVVLCQQEMKRCIDTFKALEIRPGIGQIMILNQSTFILCMKLILEIMMLLVH